MDSIMETLTKAELALDAAISETTDDGAALNELMWSVDHLLSVVKVLVNRQPEVQALDRASDKQTDKSSL